MALVFLRVLVRVCSLLLLSLIHCEANDFEFVVFSPIENVHYHTMEIPLRCDIEVGDDSVSEQIRSNLVLFDVCVQWNQRETEVICHSLSEIVYGKVKSEEIWFPQKVNGNNTGAKELNLWIDLSPDESGLNTLPSFDYKSLTLKKVVYHIGTDSITTNKVNTVLGVHFSHDAHISVVVNGLPKFALELERLANKRYYDSYISEVSKEAIEHVKSVWENVARKVVWGMNDIGMDMMVANAVVFNCAHKLHESNKVTIEAIMSGISSLVNEDTRVVIVDHHESHATLGLFDAFHEVGMKHPLVYSYDGGGNDGYSGAYIGDISANHGKALTRISQQVENEIVWGNSYAGVGAALPEVMGRSVVYRNGKSRRCMLSFDESDGWMALAGKLMGYAGLGTVRPELVNRIKSFFEQERSTELARTVNCFTLDVNAVLEDRERPESISRRDQRDIAASAQEVMEVSTVDTIRKHLAAYPSVDGIVLVGGCALNVRVNSVIASAFPHLRVHVPAAPSDCGLAIGSAWIVTPPLYSEHPQPLGLHFLGPRLFDVTYEVEVGVEGNVQGKQSSIHQLGNLLGAQKLEFTFGERNASGSGFDILARALVEENIIGVVRGRCEHGPRALGHRSLLSIPSAGMKERMNLLKHREWFRPVAPILNIEDSDRLFIRDGHHPILSPFMSFAPKVRPEVIPLLPALAHVDGTARPQTVTEQSDQWMHQLLNAVKTTSGSENISRGFQDGVGSKQSQQEEGYAVLINTSFNTRGFPILNRAKEALKLLRDCRELDMVLIEDWLFRKADVAHLLDSDLA